MKVILALDFISMCEKIECRARGTMPLSGDLELYVNPCIVYVFPVPVCPYAMIVELYPCSVDSTDSFAVFSYSSSCVLS